MATRFDHKGGFADHAAIRRKRREKTADKIDKIIDWQPIEEFLKKNLGHRHNAVGNPAYPALGMFKALLLQSWYGLSDRELSDNLEDRISFSHFCGFSLHHEVPDNSTICRFRNHLHKKKPVEPLLEMVNAQIQAGGLEIMAGAIVDASIIESARRPRKTQDVIPTDSDDDQAGGSGGYEVKTSYSSDKEAKWTQKGNRFYYGYKVHIAVDAEHGFILAGHATPANRPDCKEMMAVVKKCGLEEGSPVFADKGYYGQEYSKALLDEGLFDGIMYKAFKNRPLSEAERKVNRAISRFRGRVERAFGTLKKDHRMARARYLGAAKVGLQLMLDAIAFNLKKAARMAMA
ncbi:IS5 family transposase [Dethiosulfatarculus sandiegensis]|uniref:Transposase IS1106 n=1 Tax=Dethiosulfatarculus sandiegensis TaxID=1429043 RepID=A0A0D2IXJ9_9BACT|nr:IS5 family transposase [Dethiosulfatarculus sandiegensis]KIX10779.1 transposase IS1106 [Dethiosulfatarculus sandiegensis]